VVFIRDFTIFVQNVYPFQFGALFSPFTSKDFFLPHIHEITGVEKKFGQAQAQGFLNFFNPNPVSDLQSPNL